MNVPGSHSTKQIISTEKLPYGNAPPHNLRFHSQSFQEYNFIFISASHHNLRLKATLLYLNGLIYTDQMIIMKTNSSTALDDAR